VVEIVLNRWDFKIIERELIAMGLEPKTDFYFTWTVEEPVGWAIQFLDDSDAVIWRLRHGDKWM
jgi:hypothetical protein